MTSSGTRIQQLLKENEKLKKTVKDQQDYIAKLEKFRNEVFQQAKPQVHSEAPKLQGTPGFLEALHTPSVREPLSPGDD